jgi:hypothetical protein
MKMVGRFNLCAMEAQVKPGQRTGFSGLPVFAVNVPWSIRRLAADSQRPLTVERHVEPYGVQDGSGQLF